jgi:hypothetical protein
MDERLTDELIEAILSPLEAAEARSLALMRALTETGTISEEKLKPFLDQAENASEIKARGLRIRLKRVLADIVRQAENAKKEEDEKKQKAESETPDAKSGQKEEGPKQDPEEEASEHQAAEPGKEDQQAPENDKPSEPSKQPQPPAPRKENAA